MTPRRLTLAIAALGVAGAAIAGYLTWVHYAEMSPYCVGGGGACERVQSSPYAELAGVPVAAIGLGGYLAILASLAADRSVTVFLAFVGAGFSSYLTYLELAVIDAICQWCVASAIVMTAIAAVSAVRYVAGDERAAHYRTALRQTPDAAPGAERDTRRMQAGTHAR